MSWPGASVLITLIVSIAGVRCVRWWALSGECDCDDTDSEASQ